MIGPTWRSRAVQAVLGPNRSQLIPARLWTGWLDADGDLIAMTGLYVTHAVFGPSGDGVANIAPIDGGVAEAGWVIAGVGLFDAAAGSLIVSADLASPVTTTDGQELTIAVGALTFGIG